MLLKDFIMKFPNNSLDMMMPGGFVFLTPEQAKNLLEGKSVTGYPGDPAYARQIDAEELLSQPVESARWTNHVCRILTGMTAEPGQTDESEVNGMEQYEKECKLRERMKAGYEAYIQQLKAKPAPDLIEMASEIAAAKFIYEKLELEGDFYECTDYLSQFENPLEVLRDQWLSMQNYDRHVELNRMIWNMAEKEFGVDHYPLAKAPPGPSMEQGVAMC